MAKRKPARSATRKRAAGKGTPAAAGRPRRQRMRKAGKTLARRARTVKASGAKRRSRPATRKQARPTTEGRTARKAATSSARKTSAVARGTKNVKKTAGGTRASAPIRTALKRSTGAHRLQINRERRVLPETAPGSPSTLDFDRHASAARSGRVELREALAEHTETGPRLTGGDVDADWESAFSTGDEAPGGDMPTPDQDIVDEIGASIGVQYADDEELKSADKIEERDRKRWELDPASSDDYRDRTKKKP
jgi:hypothetical protein